MADRNSKVPGFEFRKGINNFPNFRGINRQDDPGAIPANQFYLLQNVRVEGSEIISRPGLYTGVNTGEITGIIDNLEGGAPRWWFGGSSAFDPQLSYVETISEAAWTYPAAVYNDELLTLGITGSTATLRSFNTSSRTYTTLYTFPADTHPGGNMYVSGDTLYIALYGTGASSNKHYLYTWNGTTATLDNTFTFVPDAYNTGSLPHVVVYNSEPYFFYEGTTSSNGTIVLNEIWRKASGVWASLTMPTSGNRKFSGRAAIVYDGNLYFCGWQGPSGAAVGDTTSAVILSYDGASLTIAREIGDYSTDKLKGSAIAEFMEELVYFYSDFESAGSQVSKIGTYDGSSWTDTAKDLTAQFGFDAGAGFNNRMVHTAVWNGYLFAVGLLCNTDEITVIIKSNLEDVTGTWTLIGSISFSYYGGTITFF